MADASRGAALVVGAGESTGGAIARRFAREGYVACVARRHGDALASLVEQIEKAGGHAMAFGCDARDEDQVVSMVARIERELEVAVFNPGANVNFKIRDTTARVYRKVWELACFAGFLTGREAARVMVPRRDIPEGKMTLRALPDVESPCSSSYAPCSRDAARSCSSPEGSGAGRHGDGPAAGLDLP